MQEKSMQSLWSEFLQFMKTRCTPVEYANWITPIQIDSSSEMPTLIVQNVFMREYLLDNYKDELIQFFGADCKGHPKIFFCVQEPKKKASIPSPKPISKKQKFPFDHEIKFNENYTFDNFIEGPSNQFIKSACLGVASNPGKSYNPLFIHGGVGLGKTHLLHAIGHRIQKGHKKLRLQCITTEGFINDLVYHLRNKSVDKMKRFYRTLDVFLVDDMQFLQNRLNFEEEFCNTFEILINENKQIVIASDKPPGQLKLSERMVARMEWGLVAHIGTPDLETRVAILQHKAKQKGLPLSSSIAFYIAEHIYNNVRQLEGAINRLGAFCQLMHLDATEEVVDQTLGEMFQLIPSKQISVDHILHSVSSMFNVSESDLRSSKRSKEIATARQIAMYLAKELISESLTKIGSAFGGKKHSTLIHAWKKISNEMKKNEKLRRQIQMTRHNIEA